MDKRLPIFIIAAMIIGIMAGLIASTPRFSWLLLLPLGFAVISLIFFSRGILIFLTALCLSLTGTPFAGLSEAALQFRWVLFGVFALYIFGDIFLGRTVRRIKSFDVLAVVFCSYAFFSILYSPFPRLTLERAATVFILYISVFWFIWKYAHEQGPEKIIFLLLRLMWIIFIGGFLLIFIGPVRPFMGGRFTGIFGNPNGVGIVSALMLPLSLWNFLATKKKSALFLFLIILFSLLMCRTRGALNATAVALGYFVYAYSKKNKPVVFFTSTSLMLMLSWVIETIGKKFFMGYIRAESIPILGGRLEAWMVAVSLIADKPIFGYGFGVEDKIFKLKNIIFAHHSGAYVHNSYLGMLLQLGAAGFIVFFLPLFMLLFKELSARDEGGENTPLLRYALRASLISGLICCIYESWIYSAGNAVAFPFWNVVMLLVFYQYQNKDKKATAQIHDAT